MEKYLSFWNPALPHPQFERLHNHIRRTSRLFQALKLRAHPSTRATSFALDYFMAYLTVQFSPRCKVSKCQAHVKSHHMCNNCLSSTPDSMIIQCHIVLDLVKVSEPADPSQLLQIMPLVDKLPVADPALGGNGVIDVIFGV